MKKTKKISRPRSWHYGCSRTAVMLAAYCLAALAGSILTAEAASAQKGGLTLAGGAFLLGLFYVRTLVAEYYEGLDGIPSMVLKAVAFWMLILGVSFMSSGVCIAAMM